MNVFTAIAWVSLALAVVAATALVRTGVEEAKATERSRVNAYSECVQASMRAHATEESYERNTAACGVILTFKFN